MKERIVMSNISYSKKVEKWGIFELSVHGKSDKNPFIDYQIKAVFRNKNENKTVDGFYNGDGEYKVRFMPSFKGEYTFEVFGNFDDEKYLGGFRVTEPSDGNHGPVRVSHTYHMAYEDGKSYFSIGTTCYVWNLQSIEMQEQTLETLKNSKINKIRFCVFPKHYDYNFNEPITYPYEGVPVDNSGITKENFLEYTGKTEGNDWDFTKFNIEHFELLEQRVADLMAIGIEADLIVMHPYDRWGFSQMSKEQDDLYWEYLIARLAAYRNIWWSLANEYDLMEHKTTEDWERYGSIICEKDPYNHLRSIHNCRPFYDYKRPWITHCSMQRQDVYKCAELVDEYRETYKKPVVLDEIAYEGNIQHGWGNISGKEMIRRFWETTCRGGYAGHGETYMHSDDKLWWSHGGKLYGESVPRMDFLYNILSEIPGPGLKQINRNWDEVAATIDFTADMVTGSKSYFLIYYGFNRPSFRDFYFDEETKFSVDLIDTWEMDIKNMGTFSGKFRIEMPGKEYMAVRIQKTN